MTTDPMPTSAEEVSEILLSSDGWDSREACHHHVEKEKPKYIFNSEVFKPIEYRRKVS